MGNVFGEETMGWPFAAAIIYLAAWSISFYGQTYENYKLKSYALNLCSVEGCQMDFVVYNMVGYVFYGIYTTLGYFYKDPGAGTVVIADLIFIYHGILMVLIWIIQAVIYPWGKNKISIYCIIISISMEVLIIGQLFFTEVIGVKAYIVLSCLA
jgi:hypothetical protein